MSSTRDLSQMTPEERVEVVANRYGHRPDQYVLATAGLDRMRMRASERLRRERAQTRYVVERVLTGNHAGKPFQIHQYLGNRFVRGTSARAWADAADVRVFTGWRDAERALAVKGDPDARIIKQSEMELPVDLITGLTRERLSRR